MIFHNQSVPPLLGVTGIDIETSMMFEKKHSDPFRDRILSIQIGNDEDVWVLTDPTMFRQVVPLLENPELVKIFHNASFDLQFLIHQLGAKPAKSSIYDSLLTERILNAGVGFMRHGLDDVLARRMGIMLDKEIRETIGQSGGNYSETQMNYVVEDVRHLTRLRELQLQDIARYSVGRVVALENRLTPLIARMVLKGVGFDLEHWDEVMTQAVSYVRNLESGMAVDMDMGGQLGLFNETLFSPYNLASSDQVMKLFAQRGVNVPDTDKKTLAAWLILHSDHPAHDLVRRVTEWRQWNKMTEWDYPSSINPVTGRIHCSWNQIEADTGRFSASKPNLQNVPRPEENKPNFRRLFTPAEGYRYAIWDYSQQEPRILAQVSGDEVLRQACSGNNVYLGMSPMVYGEMIEKSDIKRYTALKTGVLATIYGVSPDTLASTLNISVTAAEEFQTTVKSGFSRAAGWSKGIRTVVAAQKTTRTLLGRIRHYPDIDSEQPRWGRIFNQAVNHPVQGSGADMLKLALDMFDDVCTERGYDAVSNLVVHDEIVAEVRDDQADEVYYQLGGCLEQAGEMLCPDVPIRASGALTKFWDKA